MALKDEIVRYITLFPGSTDTEIEKALGKTHQQINQACRSLVVQGLLIRQSNPDKSGYIGNYPIENVPKMSSPFPITTTTKEPLQEEDIKHILYNYLISDGWSVNVAWGHNPGVDIDARKDGRRWMIEVKGPGSRQPMRVNYFLGILGETLQRMNDPNARYTIALPDLEQYRKLWNKLPQLAKERTTIDMILVDPDGHIELLN